ncbi:MAG: hypothetical protein NZ844_03505, partial [Chloroherpetonaceae bacterium]|nr:hypothetical protein [Chloroherpetonaceae bacterium]
MITVAEADAILQARCRAFGIAELTLAEAVGRVLAEPLIADRDFPPFHRVAMDGFALDWAAVQAGQRRFEVVHTQRAGMPAVALPKSGVAVEVMTGAVLPVGATVVVRVEDVEL